MTDRDEELGRALRDLPAPPHGDGFEDRLHALLTDEAARRPSRARRRMPRLVPALAGAVALAAVILIAIALIPGDAPRRIVPEPASAAQVVDRARAALASVSSVR